MSKYKDNYEILINNGIETKKVTFMTHVLKMPTILNAK